jgi:multidrug transporter EmrE-like cation transporter
MRGYIFIWIFVVASAALFILCDALSAHWGKTDSRNSLLLVMALSPISYYLFALVNQRVELAVAASLVNTMVVVGGIVVGVVFFGETLSHLQMAGIGMAICAVTLLNMA